ncbi:MAG: glycerophosphodiester phosphodiesterase [Desulfuromonas sp.]|nr:MAG: glycerophosphodiester phosphodiesterase [Desulfuromonas sp.]
MMICVAHRGSSGEYPENTLLAFRRALEAGATWLELDVHLSADGELIVIHDESLERTTNGSGLVGNFCLQELRRLDAGRGEAIPLLAEVLALLGEKDTLNIELKGKGTGSVTAMLLKEWLERGQIKPENLLISSFSPAELFHFRRGVSELRLAIICDQLPENLWGLAESLRLWSCHFERTLITDEMVAEAHRRGLRVLAFTVNQHSELQRLEKLGVDGVFTDFFATILMRQ